MCRKFNSVYRNFNSVNVVYFELFLLRLAYGWPKSDVADGFFSVADVAGERMAGLLLAYAPLEMLLCDGGSIILSILIDWDYSSNFISILIN